jgi:hypothetical protein
MAHTAGTQYATEFAGGYKAVSVLVDAGTQTGTVAITGITTIRGATATLAEAPTAAASLISVIGISGNVVTVNEYTPQGTLNTATALDFYLTVVGEY